MRKQLINHTELSFFFLSEQVLHKVVGFRVEEPLRLWNEPVKHGN